MIECDGLAGPPTPQQASCSQGTTTTPEPTTGLVSNNIFFFHFVAYFQVASVLSTGVGNKKVGADN